MIFWIASLLAALLVGLLLFQFRHSSPMLHSASSYVKSVGVNLSYQLSILTAPSGQPLAPVRQSKTSGPLRVSTANPRYFVDKNGRLVFLTGSHTWLNLQDGGQSDPPPVFDYPGYLDFLVTNNHNFFRLWTWEEARWITEAKGLYAFSPMPFQRSGPGLALDGKSKFDVTKFNQAYFDRLRARVIAARDRGIYVSVMLFDGWSISYPKGPNELENPWLGHPFNKNNNINGIDGDANHDNSGDETHTLAIPAVTAAQDAYVKKVLDTVKDLDNVLFEISNESEVGSLAWQNHMIDLIKSYEKQQGDLLHPVGMTSEYPDGSNQTLYASHADWISPNGGVDDVPEADGRKVVVADTDHLCGICGDSDWVWRSFTRGQNPLFMDQFDTSAAIDNSGSDLNNPEDVTTRKNLGYTLTFASCMNLQAMTPQGELASSGYALANPAGDAPEYLVYFPYGGSKWVNLAGTSKTLTLIWFNPLNGSIFSGGTLAGGKRQTVSAPFSGAAVLYLYAPSNPPSRSTPAAGSASPIYIPLITANNSASAEETTNPGVCFNQ
jgi:hypothetical protein